jgi:hypothetical protein
MDVWNMLTLFETKLTDIKSIDVEGVGTLRYESDGRVYRWVKNRSATAFAAKQPVCYDADNVGTNALFKSVNSPVTADIPLQAGLAVTAIAASGGNCFGWIMVQGYFQDARVTTPATGGNDIEVGGELVAANNSNALIYKANAGVAPVYSHHFIALEAVATATGLAAVSKDVYVNCL